MTPTLDQRLAALPLKTAAPFRQLLATGQLPEDVVQIVLDAGDLAIDKTKLLGFTAGYLHLRAQGIPVHDVIRMAKQHARRINLAWSPNRWKDEHDKLSRLETLKLLAAENVRYNLSAYQKHLPRRFPGYLIRTSRRLGMEGLRQRHCVASYHGLIATGSRAIAAVFIDNTRWTVELLLTPHADAPLALLQIKSRHNTIAPASIRRKVHDILEIAEPTLSPNTPVTIGVDAPGHLYMDNLRRILPLLRESGTQKVTVSFEGSGDSGAIGDVTYTPDETEPPQSQRVEILATSRDFDNGHWRTTVNPDQISLNSAIETITYDFLEETGINWYDNEGGYGELVIDVSQSSVTLSVSERYTEINEAYHAERDIITGEDIAA